MATPAPSSRRPTYADIEALAEGLNGEILAGELVVSPRPAPAHARAASVLGGTLVSAFMTGTTGPGGWSILDEPELSLGVDPDYDPVIPDIAGWLNETLPTLPSTPQFHVVPDWVCEILSPSTALHDRARKLPFYARAGVGHAWLLDPLARTLEGFALTEGRWTLVHVASGEEEVVLAPFEGVRWPLGSLWPPAV